MSENNPVSSLKTTTCIYRVPKCILVEEEEKFYVPQVVSIGPYHHGKNFPIDMEKHKTRAVNQVLKRNKQKLSFYLNAIKDLEKTARECYEEDINMSSNDFVKLMVRDGCFVLEVLRLDSYLGKPSYLEGDPIFAGMTPIRLQILNDILKLENQLPLVILERLVHLQDNEILKRVPITGIIFGFLSVWVGNPVIEWRDYLDQSADTCIDIFRRTKSRTVNNLIDEQPILLIDGDHPKSHRLIQSATRLRDVGIRLEMKEGVHMWDIEFKDGVLYIPFLNVTSGSKTLLFNLKFLEQFHSSKYSPIFSYFVFMLYLIESPEDVSYLKECGILMPVVKYNDISHLFEALCRDRSRDTKSYTRQLTNELNKYYLRRWNSWQQRYGRAMCRNFGSHWKVYTYIAATLVLIFIFTKMFYVVYAYYKSLK